jgi:hypothetical protein
MATTSGKLFTATLGTGTPVTITGLTRGEIREVADELDATDSDSAPYTDTDVGCVGRQGTLEANFRLGWMGAPTLKAGAVLTDLKIYPNDTTEDPYHFPQAVCLAGTRTFEVRGQMKAIINWASKGTFTEPGDA